MQIHYSVSVNYIILIRKPDESFTDSPRLVTGYTTQSRRDITGSVSVIGAEKLLSVPATEFAMEGHRFFDLVRWGVALQVLNTYLEKEKNFRTYLSGARFEERHQYYPIPQQAIVYSTKNGKATLTQNTGY